MRGRNVKDEISRGAVRQITNAQRYKHVAAPANATPLKERKRIPVASRDVRKFSAEFMQFFSANHYPPIPSLSIHCAYCTRTIKKPSMHGF